MAFCSQCGTKLDPNARFCPNCGTAVAAGAAQQPYRQPEETYRQQEQQPYQPSREYAPTDAFRTAESADARDVRDNKGMAVLAYLGILVLIPIFAAKESRFARFHANQGLVLLLFEIGFGIVCSIFAAIFAALFLFRATALYAALMVLLAMGGGIFFLVLLILGIVNACGGNCRRLPVIGKIDILR